MIALSRAVGTEPRSQAVDAFQLPLPPFQVKVPGMGVQVMLVPLLPSEASTNSFGLNGPWMFSCTVCCAVGQRQHVVGEACDGADEVEW